MFLLRKWLILVHRWLGVPLSLVFVVWFASGVVMMYTGDMPRLTPELRLERLPDLDLSRARLTPAQAVRRARLPPPADRAVLSMVTGRPAYRFDGVIVFADTGEALGDVGVPGARAVAARFTGLPEDRMRRVGTLTEPDRLLVAADTMQIRDEPFSTESLLARLAAAAPDAPVVESAVLHEYDSYYYSRGRRTPLPVLRVKLADPGGTWLYVDPRTSRLLAGFHRLNRVERWLFNGLHSLDFAFWRDRRPLWDVGLIALSAGGLASSGIGLWMGLGRVRRAFGRMRARLRPTRRSLTA